MCVREQHTTTVSINIEQGTENNPELKLLSLMNLNLIQVSSIQPTCDVQGLMGNVVQEFKPVSKTQLCVFIGPV